MNHNKAIRRPLTTGLYVGDKEKGEFVSIQTDERGPGEQCVVTAKQISHPHIQIQISFWEMSV